MLGFDFVLDIHDIDVCVDNSFEVLSNRCNERVKLEVVVNEIHIPALVNLFANLEVYITHIFRVAEAIRIDFVAINELFGAAHVSGIQTIYRCDIERNIGSIFTAEQTFLFEIVEQFSADAHLSVEHGSIGI